MNIVEQRIKESIELKSKILLDSALLKTIEGASQSIIDCYKRGNKVLFCGNGGSAADAQHLAAELSGRYLFDRKSLAAEAMHVNTSYVTAVGNDYSFNQIYARYLTGAGKKGDILVAISTSGNSGNIIMAAETAHSIGMKVISLTGKSGGKLAEVSDFLINVPSTETPRIQEAHIMIGHIICELVESTIFGNV